MEAIKLHSHMGADGRLTLFLPEALRDRPVEVLLLFEPIPLEATTEDLGYASGYFESTYGALADDPIERGEQPPPAQRELFA